ncbi:hypothetical protein [Myroides sp. LJL119]
MKSSDFFKFFSAKIVKNFQFLISGFYLFAIGIGMLFSDYKYKAFGINIFEYASVFDFLIAPFADFRILLFTLITLLLTYGLFVLDHFWQQNFPTQYSKSILHVDRFWFYKKIKGIFSVLCFVVYLILAAGFYGKITYKQTLKQNPVRVQFTPGQRQSGILIGKTSDMLFLYDQKTVHIIPLMGVVQSISY